MTDHNFVLIVPPIGLLEVVHAERPIDAEATIRQRNTTGMRIKGEYMNLRRGDITMSWFSDPNGVLNQRAAEAFAMLSHAHFVLTGTVLFQGIEERALGEIVGRLSTREAAGDGTP